MEPQPTRDRVRSPHARAERASSLRRTGAALALAALVLAAAAATAPERARHLLAAAAATAPERARYLLAASALPARAAFAKGSDALARLVAPAPRRRAMILTSVGIGLGCIPLAVLGVRRRRREDALDRAARLHQARAPQIFEAALVACPLRRGTDVAAPDPRQGDGLPPFGPVPPEVASRAVALRAPSVREAAARAVLLRAASERSESRRRAAALRARARRNDREPAQAAYGEATPGATPGVEPDELWPSASEAPVVSARSRRAMVELALEIPEPLRSAAAGRPTAAPAAREPVAAPERRTAEAGETTSPARGAGRVAILRESRPLTFEWLERCLARDPQDLQARLDLCTALLVAERFADAERVAREGLARDDGDGRLLLRLSEALAGLARTDEALEVAIRAVRQHRSRKAVLHLTRLSALARRFAPGDGPRLRKALESRPSDPVFLYALGVFESLHGSPREALELLRLALRQERTPRWRRIVSREIARLRAEELAGADRERQRARA